MYIVLTDISCKNNGQWSWVTLGTHHIVTAGMYTIIDSSTRKHWATIRRFHGKDVQGTAIQESLYVRTCGIIYISEVRIVRLKTSNVVVTSDVQLYKYSAWDKPNTTKWPLNHMCSRILEKRAISYCGRTAPYCTTFIVYKVSALATSAQNQVN